MTRKGKADLVSNIFGHLKGRNAAKVKNIGPDVETIQKTVKLLRDERSLAKISEQTGLEVSLLNAIRQGKAWKAINGGEPIPCSDSNRSTSLTDAEALAIYKSAKRGVSYGYLSKKYGVSRQVISKIKTKRTWKHLHKRG